jgi:hypothetical protein
MNIGQLRLLIHRRLNTCIDEIQELCPRVGEGLILWKNNVLLAQKVTV